MRAAISCSDSSVPVLRRLGSRARAREVEDREEVEDDEEVEELDDEELDDLRLAHLEMADSTTAAIAPSRPPPADDDEDDHAVGAGLEDLTQTGERGFPR